MVFPPPQSFLLIPRDAGVMNHSKETWQAEGNNAEHLCNAVVPGSCNKDLDSGTTNGAQGGPPEEKFAR